MSYFLKRRGINFAEVKKIASILLLFLYVFGSTDAYQLLKLPALVQHYAYHRQMNPDLALTDFWQIHYNSPIVIDDDFDKDMRLPFKTTQVEFSQTIQIIAPPNTNSVEVLPVFKDPYQVVYDEVIPQFLNNKSIFQPPRFV